MENKREVTTQMTVLAAVISLLFPFTALFIDILIQDSFSYTFSDFAGLYSENPLHWIILSLIIIIPAVTYFTTKYFSNVINRNKKNLEYERNKTRTIQEFTRKLIEEDFSHDLEVSEDDSLGKSLLNLRDKLKSNKENEIIRRKEDEQRNWTAEGLARFGDILRNDIDDLELLSFNVTKELTKYINATQGCFYLLKDGNGQDKYFDMSAFFAYDRKKFADKRIKWGDGLIGTSALEKKSIYITDVPDDYVSVTSGLGYTNPKSILIVPLIKEEELFGAIEFASLNKIESYQLEFVEKVAENIASTLSMANINIKTSRLLEETKAQTEALASQEEEMRQNMEELQSTQEEATRQAERFILLENTINHTMIRAEYDKKGYLVYANTNFIKKLEYKIIDEVDGKHVSEFVNKKDREWFSGIWNGLAKGGSHYEGYMRHLTKTGKDLWTVATYTCVKHEDNEVEKILFLALDISEQKDQSLKMEGIIDSVDRSGIKAELDINGNIINFNEAFQLLIGYNSKEIKSLSVFDLIDNLELEGFIRKWDNIVKGIGFQGQFKLRAKKDEEKWIRGAFGSSYNVYGEIDRIFIIGQDITKEKNMETSINDQTEILMHQEKSLREAKKETSKKIREVKLEMKQEYEIIERIKDRNEQTLELSPDAIFTIASDNKIIYFNNAAEKMWGYKREKVLNNDIGMLFSIKVIDEDEFVAALAGPGDNKIINTRKKTKIVTSDRKEKEVFILLVKATTEEEITYTAFIQNI